MTTKREMKPLYFRLKGLTPLLMNNPSGMLIARETKARSTTKDYDPEEDAKKTRYLLPDGTLYVPAVAVRASLLKGSIGTKFGKYSAQSILSAGIELSDPEFPITDEFQNPMPENKYKADIRTVVIQGSRVVKGRAMVELPWFVECTFMYDENMLSNRADFMLVVNRGGSIAGLLDYRPSKKGWFGKYEIVEDSLEM